MGYIAAAVTKKQQDASPIILKMLQASGGTQAPRTAIASHQAVETYSKPPEFTSHTAPALLAYKTYDPSNYPPQPLIQGSTAIAFNGIIYDTETPDSLEAANILEEDNTKGIETLITEREAAFTVAALEKNRLILGRDHVGTIPLYIGENKEAFAAASNKKALWALGIKPRPVKPGTLTEITEIRVKTRTLRQIAKPKQTVQPLNDTIKTLHRIMTETATKIAKKRNKAAVAFSGGIDSTLAAYYLKDAGMKLDLICVGINQRKEYTEAQEAADALNLQVEIVSYTRFELEEIIDKLLLSIEDHNPMKVGVGAPLYLATSQAVEKGYNNIISGNGSDEVFGGYMKYLKQHMDGLDATMSMYDDTVNSWKNNFDRDTKISNDLGVNLLLPFTHPKLIQYGLSIPIQHKLTKSQGQPRKKVIRELGKHLGIPDKTSDRPKKAAQYSTGVNQKLRKIAKRHGKKLGEFLEDRLHELRKEHRWTT
ncbi:MAG: asparagine synthetase B [Candidatus Bathyarchaeota archaeon]|nr:asparagine synthetase B [Candidatus Bathyarchaeota archaeon]